MVSKQMTEKMGKETEERKTEVKSQKFKVDASVSNVFDTSILNTVTLKKKDVYKIKSTPLNESFLRFYGGCTAGSSLINAFMDDFKQIVYESVVQEQLKKVKHSWEDYFKQEDEDFPESELKKQIRENAARYNNTDKINNIDVLLENVLSEIDCKFFSYQVQIIHLYYYIQKFRVKEKKRNSLIDYGIYSEYVLRKLENLILSEPVAKKDLDGFSSSLKEDEEVRLECLISIIKSTIVRKVMEDKNNLFVLIGHVSELEYKPLYSRGLLAFIKGAKNRPNTVGFDELHWFKQFKLIDLGSILPKINDFIAFLNTL